MGSKKWTSSMQIELMAGVRAGKSRGQMARKLGVSRSAAIIKYARLNGKLFESDKQKKHQRLLARQERKARKREIINKAEGVISDGLKRGLPIWLVRQMARMTGVSMMDLATICRVSKQAIACSLKHPK